MKIESIFSLIIGIAVGWAITGSYFSHNYHISTVNPEPQIVYVTAEPEAVKEIEYVTEYVYLPYDMAEETPETYLNISYEDQELLERIAMAEARSEGSVGMAYVMRVVLNRAERDNMSIHDVIYAPHQFYTAGMCSGNEECHEALQMVLDGWDESQGAYYFTAGGYGKYGEPLFSYKNHYFSK